MMNRFVLSVLPSLLSVLVHSEVHAFSFPTETLPLENGTSLDENLFKTYYDEIRNFDAQWSGDLKSPAHAQKLSKQMNLKNQEALKPFLNSVKKPTSPMPRALDLKDVQRVWDLTFKHPIVGEAQIENYGPKSFKIGYCFGRATFAHLELLRMGVHPSNLRKIFAIGKFIHKGLPWDFHAVTAVRSSSSSAWWVIDTSTSERVEPVSAWLKNVERLARNPQHPAIRYYVTDALKFHPLYGAYTRELFSMPDLQEYFSDMMKWFDQNPVTFVISRAVSGTNYRSQNGRYFPSNPIVSQIRFFHT